MSYASDIKAKIENENEMSRIKSDFERTGYGMKDSTIFVVRMENVRKHAHYYKVDATVYISGDVIENTVPFRRLAYTELGFNGSDDVIDMIKAILEKTDKDIQYKGLMYRAEIEDFERGLKMQEALDEAAENAWREEHGCNDDDEYDEVIGDEEEVIDAEGRNVTINIY